MTLSVIQLARLGGFSPIITTASLHNKSYLESLGATHVVDRSAPLGPAIQSITAKPITVIFDTISLAETQNPAWDALAPNGKLVLLLPVAIDEVKLKEGQKEGKAISSTAEQKMVYLVMNIRLRPVPTGLEGLFGERSPKQNDMTYQSSNLRITMLSK